MSEPYDSTQDDERPRIKVTDRRLFDSSGNLREPSHEPEVESAEGASAAAAPATPAPEPKAAPAPEREPAPAPEREAAPASREVPPATPPAAAPPARPTPPSDAGARRSTEPAAASAPGAAPPSPATPNPAHDAGAGLAADGPDDGQPSGPEALPRDFAGFIESQYYEALLYLGAIRHPATGEVVDDPPMAQFKIDLLTMLHEKTEGNRTPEESKMLDDVLYQLRMLFLQKSKVVKL